MELIQEANELIERLTNQTKNQNLNQTNSNQPNQNHLSKHPPLSFNFGFPKRTPNFETEVLTFVEIFYNEHQRLPSQDEIIDQFSSNEAFNNCLPNNPDDWKALYQSLVTPLTNRGLPFVNPDDQLDPHFVLAVGLVTNPYAKKSLNAKLKEAGLTSNQWNNFLKLPKYRAYLDSQVNKLFDDDTLSIAKLGLRENIASGDLASIRFFYEVQNLYRPEAESSAHLISIIHVLMEILARHVSSEILLKVQEDFANSNVIEATLNNNNINNNSLLPVGKLSA